MEYPIKNILPPKDYSRGALYNRVYNEIINNPEKYYGDTDDIEMGVEGYTRWSLDSIDTFSFGEEMFAPVAIKERNLDILLFIFREQSYVGQLIRKISNSGDVKLIEDFFNLLNKDDMKKLVTTTPLDILIRIPRYKDNCNEDLVNLYFEYFSENKLELSGLYRSLAIAKESHCPNLLKSIMDNINKLKREGYKNKDLDYSLNSSNLNKEKL